MINLLFHWSLAIFRSLCIPGVNGSVIKEVRSGLCLWANPVSCFTGLWCQGGQRMSSEVRKHSTKQSSQSDMFLTRVIVSDGFHPEVCFSVFEIHWMTVVFLDTSHSWVCYLGISAENMALHFIHWVHPVCHSAEVEPPEHHFILSQSPWRWS